MGEGELSSILGLITPKQSLDPRQILFNDKDRLRIVTFSTTLALIRVMGRASLQFPNTVSSNLIVGVKHFTLWLWLTYDCLRTPRPESGLPAKDCARRR